MAEHAETCPKGGNWIKHRNADPYFFEKPCNCGANENPDQDLDNADARDGETAPIRLSRGEVIADTDEMRALRLAKRERDEVLRELNETRAQRDWERREWPRQIAEALGISEADMGRTPSMASAAVKRLGCALHDLLRKYFSFKSEDESRAWAAKWINACSAAAEAKEGRHG